MISYLVEYGKKEALKPVLFPSGDPYVEFMDKNFEVLKEYYLFPMDQKGKWTDIMLKDTLEKLALEFGMPIPESVVLHDEHLEEVV